MNIQSRLCVCFTYAFLRGEVFVCVYVYVITLIFQSFGTKLHTLIKQKLGIHLPFFFIAQKSKRQSLHPQWPDQMETLRKSTGLSDMFMTHDIRFTGFNPRNNKVSEIRSQKCLSFQRLDGGCAVMFLLVSVVISILSNEKDLYCLFKLCT